MNDTAFLLCPDQITDPPNFQAKRANLLFFRPNQQKRSNSLEDVPINIHSWKNEMNVSFPLPASWKCTYDTGGRNILTEWKEM